MSNIECADTLRADGDLAPRPGRPELIGRYVLLHQIGEGGMGVVYEAYDPELERRIAIKLLDPDLGPIREAQAMAALAHPNVVSVFDVGEVDGQTFIAMELVEGRTLREWCEERPRTREEILQVFSEAARGLSAAHRAGIVHRDFKPDNVLIGYDGRVKVTDFGLAIRVADESGTGELRGTPAYMAPEQLTEDVVGEAADQFSFCVTLHEALYGRRPFHGDTLAELLEDVLNGEVPPEPAAARCLDGRVRSAVLRGLSRNADERFPSMDALCASLREPPRHKLSRWRTVAALSMLTTMGLVACAFVPVPTVNVFTHNADAAAEFFSGEVRLSRNNSTRALKAFEHAADLDPGFVLAHYRAAQVRDYVGLPGADERLSRAQRLLRRATDEDRARADREIRMMRALDAKLDGRTDDAIAELKALLDEYPRDAEASFKVGDLLLHSGRVFESILWFRATLEIDPSADRAWDHLLHAYAHLGDRDTIRALIPEYLDRLRTAAAYVRATQAYLSIGDREAASALANHGIELYPGHTNLRQTQAAVLVFEEDYDGSMRAIREVRDPASGFPSEDRARTRMWEVWQEAHRGHYQQVAVLLDRAAQGFSGVDRSRLLAQRAFVLAEFLDRSDEAREIIEKIDATHRAEDRFVGFWIDQVDRTRTIGELEDRLSRPSFFSPIFSLELGQAYLRAGRTREAIDVLEKAIGRLRFNEAYTFAYPRMKETLETARSRYRAETLSARR